MSHELDPLAEALRSIDGPDPVAPQDVDLGALLDAPPAPAAEPEHIPGGLGALGLLSKGHARAVARKFLKPRCEGCGTTADLEAHHVDQDYQNNTAENVQTLCSICHDFWHGQAKRNGRPIAGRMPPLYEDLRP